VVGLEQVSSLFIKSSHVIRVGVSHLYVGELKIKRFIRKFAEVGILSSSSLGRQAAEAYSKVHRSDIHLEFTNAPWCNLYFSTSE